MSKNMTRKGLAFGAGFALVASGLAAAPANAIELDEGVPMEPTVGFKEHYATFAGDGENFRLTASPISSAMQGAGTVKFKINDLESKFLPGESSQVAFTTEIAAGTGDVAFIDEVNERLVLTVETSISNGSYIVYAPDENLVIDDNTNSDGNTVALTKDALTSGFVSNGKLLISSENDLNSSNATGTLDAAVAQTKLVLVKGSSFSSTTNTHTMSDNTAFTENDTNDTLLEAADSGLGNSVATLVIADDTFTVGADDANPTTFAASGSVMIATTSGSGHLLLNSPAAVDISASKNDLIGERTLTEQVLASSVRESDNSFVVDSGIALSSQTATIDIVQIGSDTESVSVQAFVDDFENNKIDAGSEYTSSEQTIQFVKRSDLIGSVALDAPKIGDSTLDATVTTSPALNWTEVGVADALAVGFTRQDSDQVMVDDNMSYDTSTGKLTASLSTASTGASLDELQANGTLTAAQEWDFTRAVAGTNVVETDSSVSNEVATIKFADHKLRVGDKVTISGVTGATALNGEKVVTSVPSTDTFTFAATGVDDLSELAGTVTYTVTTYGSANSLVDRVFAGDHSAQLYEELTSNVFTKLGSASALGTQAAVADDVIFSTVGTEDVQGITSNDSDAGVDLFVATGTTSFEVTATVVDEDDDAVGSGRAVDYTIDRGGDNTIEVNGKTTGDTLLTDSDGQVTFTVTDTNGSDGKSVSITATAEGVSGSSSKLDIEWDDKTISMIDLATTGAEIADSETRYIAEGQSYTLDLLVADQFFTAADSDEYRVKVAGSGVTQGFESLTDGRATVEVADAGVASSFDVVLTLQKAGTDGEFADTTTVKTITHNTTDNGKLLLGAEASTLYGSAVDLSDEVAEKALVEADNRAEAVAIPAYANKVTVNGKAMDASTSVKRAGAVVTISGPSNILFENGTLRVSKRGSLTVLADSNGLFEFDLYSTTAQEDTEITVSSLGVEETVDVTFTGKGIGEATELTLTAPSNVQPSSTFQVTGSLKDDFGNGVPSAAIEVTYLGPGITFGDLPSATDANGNFRFSVLLGANDTDDISVTVSYDQNADGDYADAKDLTEATTIAIGGSSDQKVNAGSFKGYVAVYALGYEGQRLSAKIGNDWVIVDPIVNNQSANLARVTDFTGAGVDIQVRIYIDRVLVDTIPLTTK